MKSFISHLTLLKHFLSMGSFMVPLYILRNLFKHGAHPYTCALWFITQGFNPSFHMKRKFDQIIVVTEYSYKSLRINTTKTWGVTHGSK
jgi:hypothetical protein